MCHTDPRTGSRKTVTLEIKSTLPGVPWPRRSPKRVRQVSIENNLAEPLFFHAQMVYRVSSVPSTHYYLSDTLVPILRWPNGFSDERLFIIGPFVCRFTRITHRRTFQRCSRLFRYPHSSHREILIIVYTGGICFTSASVL